MRRRLAIILVSGLLTLSAGGVASADYTDAFGHTWTTAQVNALCAAMRPSLAAQQPYCH